MTHLNTDRPAQPWIGRDDGDAPEHARWFKIVQVFDANATAEDADAVLIGFASDEGVRRNKGRQGAKEAPGALRTALAGMSLTSAQAALKVFDAGDVVVDGQALEGGQQRLAKQVATIIDDCKGLPIVLGGGHEVAFGTYSGVAQSARRTGQRIGILNLDAHFDLRQVERPSSGTPFRQALEAEREAGTELRYAIVGISQPSNTQALFNTAEEFGVRYLLDTESQVSDIQKVREFIAEFTADIDLLYLTMDLDVLPAAVAPGVSAPAGYGVPLEVILAAVTAAAQSGKLVAADIAELNPSLDVDHRTARTAARILHTILNHLSEEKAQHHD